MTPSVQSKAPPFETAPRDDRSSKKSEPNRADADFGDEPRDAPHPRAAQVPALRGVFGLEALSRAEWATVLKFAAPILLVEECTKAVGRLLDARALAARKAAEA